MWRSFVVLAIVCWCGSWFSPFLNPRIAYCPACHIWFLQAICYGLSLNINLNCNWWINHVVLPLLISWFRSEINRWKISLFTLCLFDLESPCPFLSGPVLAGLSLCSTMEAWVGCLYFIKMFFCSTLCLIDLKMMLPILSFEVFKVFVANSSSKLVLL